MVIGVELVVDLDVEPRAVGSILRGHNQVPVRTRSIDGGGRIRGREGIVRKEIVGDSVKTVLRDGIARERIARPGSVSVLSNRGWIVNRVSDLLAGRIEEVRSEERRVGKECRSR